MIDNYDLMVWLEIINNVVKMGNRGWYVGYIDFLFVFVIYIFVSVY